MNNSYGYDNAKTLAQYIADAEIQWSPGCTPPCQAELDTMAGAEQTVQTMLSEFGNRPDIVKGFVMAQTDMYLVAWHLFMACKDMQGCEPRGVNIYQDMMIELMLQLEANVAEFVKNDAINQAFNQGLEIVE